MRRAVRRAQPGSSPLTVDDVYTQVYEHAKTTPLTTADIREYCKAHHPDYPGITTLRVSHHLHYLARRGRVQSWVGTDTDALAHRGVDYPDTHAQYWALPAPDTP